MIRTSLIALAVPALLSAAQDLEPPVPPVPPLLVDGLPNPRFEADLRATAQALKPEQRLPWFSRVRERQRELKRRVVEVRMNLDHLQDSRDLLEKEGSALKTEAQALVEREERALEALRTMDQAIDRLRKVSDPTRVDSDELKVDLYAGVLFSSLYEQDQAGSFFNKGKPFVALDIRQTFRRPGQPSWVETFSTLSFQSSSIEHTETVNVITTSGNFRADAGAWWMKQLTDGVSWGVQGSLGVVGFSQTPQADGVAGGSRNEFRNRAHLGLTLRQEDGSFKGSFAEWAYLRDPLFIVKDRLWVRGRVILTPLGSQGASGDFYMEGSVSKGRTGRDEAQLMVGLRLSTIAFLRSLGAKN